MSKTAPAPAPAPASGDVGVPRELLESLSSTRPHRFGCVCVFCDGIDRIKAHLSSAPRPSGDPVRFIELKNLWKALQDLGIDNGWHPDPEAVISSDWLMRCKAADEQIGRMTDDERETFVTSEETEMAAIRDKHSAVDAYAVLDAAFDNGPLTFLQSVHRTAVEHVAYERSVLAVRRPSGDVAAKLTERLRHAASYMYDIHSQGGGWQTGTDVRPALLCDAADTLLSLTERIATLEQERTARDAALEPFAEAAASIDESDKDSWSIWEHPAAVELRILDLRRAAAVLSQMETPEIDTGCDDDKLPGTADDWRNALEPLTADTPPAPQSGGSPVGDDTPQHLWSPERQRAEAARQAATSPQPLDGVTEERVLAGAKAIYALEPFRMPVGQRIDGVEVCRPFDYEDAPAYRQIEAQQQARACLIAASKEET